MNYPPSTSGIYSLNSSIPIACDGFGHAPPLVIFQTSLLRSAARRSVFVKHFVQPTAIPIAGPTQQWLELGWFHVDFMHKLTS